MPAMGAILDLTHRGERPHRLCPPSGGDIAIALYDTLDDGLLPGRTGRRLGWRSHHASYLFPGTKVTLLRRKSKPG